MNEIVPIDSDIARTCNADRAFRSDTVEINADISRISNLDAERSILGAILLDNAAYSEAAGQLHPQDFSLESHRILFHAMASLVDLSRPIDMITLIEELDRSRKLEPIGGVAYVSSLIEGVPERPSVEHYVHIVKEKAQLRALVHAGKLSIQRVIGGSRPQEVTAGLLEAVLDVEAQSNRSGVVTPQVFMSEILQSMEKQAASQGLIGLSTGLDCLDKAIGGLRDGELIVVGARPGAGKTALAGQIAMAACSNKIPVGMFSLEMSRWDLGRRFLSAITNVAAWQIRDPRYIRTNDEAWRALAKGAAEVAGWPLYVDDNGSLEISEIIARAKLFIARKNAKLIIVDYLQLVRAPIGDIRERVGAIADQLRLLAKTERVPVVLLSQLRRPQNMKDEPTLMDLKESGDIEAHAHVVLLIHSPVGPEGLPSDDQKIIVAKNRNGMRGMESVKLNNERLLFQPK